MNNFEKALESHKKLLAERWEKNKEMELKQIEENLRGISELVDKLYEEVEKMKQVPKWEEPKKYQMNVYIAKPTDGEGVWWLNNFGELCSANWANAKSSDELYFNTNLFKDKESAETYHELLNDMKRLSKKFGNDDYCIGYNYSWGRVEVSYKTGSYQRDYYFTRENAEFILNKYGQDVLRNFIKYCK